MAADSSSERAVTSGRHLAKNEAEVHDSKRTHTARGDEIERLRQARGFSLERLASKAGVHVRTVKRMIAGQQAFWSNINAVAGALGVPCRTLLSPSDATAEDRVPFSVQLSMEGAAEKSAIVRLATLPEELLRALAKHGIYVSKVTSKLVVQSDLEPKWELGLVGANDETEQFAWYIMVMRTGMRSKLMARLAQPEPCNLDEYGEVIAAGYGSEIPEWVLRQVRELYQCDTHAAYDRALKRWKTEGKI
jgi:transcriptional regulator with XRE-family HTH domain